MSQGGPQIKPHKTREYTYKQSRFEHVPQLPTRMMIAGPSGGGKSVLITNLILDIYKGCFARIHIFSPTIHVDDTWLPVKRYVENELRVPQDELADAFHDEFREADLERIIRRNMAIAQLSKQKGMKRLYQTLVVLDDIADDVRASRSRSLGELFVRGRHASCSVIASVQKIRVLPQLVRVNATDWCIFSLRNIKELESIVIELSGKYGIQATWALFEDVHGGGPYNFVWANLRAKTKEETFWQNFDEMVVPRRVTGQAGRQEPYPDSAPPGR